VSDTAKNNQETNQDGVKSLKESQQVRILIVINNSKILSGGVSFLKRRGYQVIVVNHIVEALKKIQTTKPHVVLISWNLKLTDIQKAYKLFTQKFKLICISFAEDNNNRTANTLMSSGIENTLLAPVSGPGIHMRVQSLLRAKKSAEDKLNKATASAASKAAALANSASSKSTPITNNENPIEIHNVDVPPDTVWEKAIDGSSSPDQCHMWRGTSTNQDNSKDVYYFKGAQIPVYNKESKSWDGIDNDTSIMKQGDLSAQSLVALQSSTIITEDSSPVDLNLGKDIESLKNELFDASKTEDEESIELSPVFAPLTADRNDDIDPSVLNEFSDNTNATDAEVNPDFNEVSDFEENTEANNLNDTNERSPQTKKYFKNDTVSNVQTYVTKEKQSILVQSVRDSFDLYAIATSVIPIEIGLFTNILAIQIKTSRYRGYLIFFSATDKPNQEWVEQVFKLIQTKMKDYGEPIKPAVTMQFAVPAIDFVKWREGEAEFIITATHKADKYAVAFLPISEIPIATDNNNSKVDSISLGSYIVGDSELLFDLYLHLPKNDKFILYLKKNDIITQNNLSKLLKFGIKTVYVKHEERHLFFAYCARNRIISSTKHIES